MGNITSFEVLAQPLVPDVPDVPYVQQGFFLQVSNVSGGAPKIDLEFSATPRFVVSDGGAVNLFANYINEAGIVTEVPPEQFVKEAGFRGVEIPSGGTYIFGVQYALVPRKSINLVGSTPQDGLGSRGYLELKAFGNYPQFLVLATIRQVFNNYDGAGNLINVSEAAYSVPLVGGPLQQF